jgi:hypothetical protein
VTTITEWLASLGLSEYAQWEQAKRGDGQVVLISGELGIGKSGVRSPTPGMCLISAAIAVGRVIKADPAEVF